MVGKLRGRPKKDQGGQGRPEDRVVGRGRGPDRPRKHAAQVVGRGPGRPRKYAATGTSQVPSDQVVEHVVGRGRGRPRKYATVGTSQIPTPRGKIKHSSGFEDVLLDDFLGSALLGGDKCSDHEGKMYSVVVVNWDEVVQAVVQQIIHARSVAK